MKLLAIETATQICSVALIKDERLIAEIRLNLKNVHAAKLFGLIETVLQHAGWKANDLHGVAVSIGPGSFTGLRIGLSSAKGLALGANLPLIAVPTLEALARHAPVSDGTICPVLRSRVDEYYFAIYERHQYYDTYIRDVQVLKADALLSAIPENAYVLGDVERLLQNQQAVNFSTVPQHFNYCSALSVATIGAQKLQADDLADMQTIEPLYYQEFVAGKPKRIAL